MLAIGIIAPSWPATILGASVVVALAFALAVTMPLGRRVRRHRLEFAWWLAHAEPGSGGGAVVPGKPFDVRCFLRHRGTLPLSLRDLLPVVPGGAQVIADDSSALSLEANARTDFTF